MPTAHHRKDCPGRCGRRIIHAMLTCEPCWRELPKQLREAVTDTDAERQRRRAVLAWFRAQTTQESTNV